jgi:hypothetical protein
VLDAISAARCLGPGPGVKEMHRCSQPRPPGVTHTRHSSTSRARDCTRRSSPGSPSTRWARRRRAEGLPRACCCSRETQHIQIGRCKDPCRRFNTKTRRATCRKLPFHAPPHPVLVARRLTTATMLGGPPAMFGVSAGVENSCAAACPHDARGCLRADLSRSLITPHSLCSSASTCKRISRPANSIGDEASLMKPCYVIASHASSGPYTKQRAWPRMWP